MWTTPGIGGLGEFSLHETTLGGWGMPIGDFFLNLNSLVRSVQDREDIDFCYEHATKCLGRGWHPF